MSLSRPIVVAALLVALAGCGGDPEPQFEESTPTPSPSTTSAAPSPSPSVTQGTSPVDALRTWVDARNQALSNGDTTELRGLTSPDCTNCETFIATIEDTFAAGGSYQTTGWEVKSAKVKTASDTRAAVDAAVVFGGGSTVESAGADPIKYGPTNHIIVFKFEEEVGDETWLLRGITFLS